jgi:site-specific recombinase XerC
MSKRTSSLPPRRGRPVGAITELTVQPLEIKQHEAAFLRAVLQGLPPKDAVKRYLVDALPDTRTGNARFKALIDRLINALGGLRKSRAMDDRLDILRKVALGTHKDIHSAVQALNWVITHHVVSPLGSDMVERWFSSSVTNAVRPVGVLTLNDLVNYINLRGARWYTHINVIGKNKAHRITQWLIDHESSTSATLSNAVTRAVATDGDAHPRSSLDDSFVQTYALVPLNALRVPDHLSGADGVFRSHQVNSLGAHTDSQAIHAWLQTIKQKSPLTYEAYARETERLYLWAVIYKKKALSSLDSVDCAGFDGFLQAPPKDWICASPAPRSSAAWRPFRGPLSARSAQRSMIVARSLFKALLSLGYLRVDPFFGQTTRKSQAFTLDTGRSLHASDRALMSKAFNELSDGPHKRRLRAMILLYETSGFRRSEVGAIRRSNVVPLRVDGDISKSVYGVEIVGKNQTKRTVPITLVALAAVDAHLADRTYLIQKGELGIVSEQGGLKKILPFSLTLEKTPLLSVLKPAVFYHKRTESSVEDVGAMSESAVYAQFKSFFGKIANRDDLNSGISDFKKVSPHWLRHTFALAVLDAANNDLTIVQGLLGHVNISTTAIYTKADISKRAKAVSDLKGSL